MVHMYSGFLKLFSKPTASLPLLELQFVNSHNAALLSSQLELYKFYTKYQPSTFSCFEDFGGVAIGVIVGSSKVCATSGAT